MPAFPRLFEPFHFGALRLKNRLVMLPHGTGMMRDGMGTAEDDAYVEARARGGVGLMISGAMLVHSTAVRRSRKTVEAFDERMIASMASKAALVHRHGVALIGQLFHMGREMLGEEFEEHAVAPSPLRSSRDAYPPHELQEDEIRDIITGYGTTAHNLMKAGFDGAEIHGAHGYLVSQFLSPATNRRDDAWGGDEVRRFRFLAELIDAIRARCGSGFVLGLRVTADEELADGLDLPAMARMSRQIAKHGGVDYLNVALGVRGGYVKDTSWPQAPAARAGKIIRDACGLPIILGQRINTPAAAESLLINGSADLVGMVRALIADPDWPTKAAQGDTAAIRPCIGLLQDCRNQSPHLHCAANPRAGRETRVEFSGTHRAQRKRRVAVIGGGPGGMEAARTLVERGHEAVLFESSDGLGGQFLYAASLPKRSGLAALLDHLQSELRRFKVRVELGSRIVAPADLGPGFDAAIVATGALASPLAADHRPTGALSWFDVLEKGAPEPRGCGTAVMVDDGAGFWWTYGVAEMLVNAGWRIFVVTPGLTPLAHIPHESTGPLLSRLGRGDVQFRVLSSIAAITPGELRIARASSGEEETLACDLVVIQTGRHVDPGPLAALKAAGLPVQAIGDCVSPRRLSHALYEAQKAAHAV